MKVHINELHRLVRLLANQGPVRYYLRAGSTETPYSHMEIEVWFLSCDDNADVLNHQLMDKGWLMHKTAYFSVSDGRCFKTITWRAERDWIPEPEEK